MPYLSAAITILNLINELVNRAQSEGRDLTPEEFLQIRQHSDQIYALAQAQLPGHQPN